MRVLAKEAGSTSGKYRTARVEIARGPMLAATEPGVRKISAMVATQLLKTTLIENLLGFHIHLDPCPILIVQPKDASATQFSKERISPFIKATPKLRSLVGSSKTRSAGDTLDYKAFPGGFLGIVGAGSPDNLARRPVRLVLCDEVDKYVPLKEGKPLDIVEERQATFESNSLNVAVCSPTITGESNIEARVNQSDQRRASVECPHCHHRQFLEFFKHVHWERGKDGKTHRPETAAIHCEQCKKSWSEGQRLRSLDTIRWHQTRAFECCDVLQKPLDRYAAAVSAGHADAVNSVWEWWSSPRHAVYRAKCSECGTWAVPNIHAGFQASKLFSPWANDAPPMIAGKWLAAVDEDGKLTFHNTQLALTYRKNTSKAVAADSLLARRETWPTGYVPDGVAVITAGIDTQDYRIEIEIVGWGRDEESWSIEYHVIDGEMSDPATQLALDEYLSRVWYRADERPFELRAACHDSGGHHTNAVYDFSKARLGRKIWAIKGKGSKTAERDPVWPTKRPSSRTKKTFRPIGIGVNAAKDDILLSYLPRTKPGPGYMHFHRADWDIGAFEQLTSEQIHIEGKGTNKIRKWVPIEGRANERLDCRVYALAALRGLKHMGLNLNREADRVGAVVTDVDPDDHVYRDRPDAPSAPVLPAAADAEMPEPTDAPPAPAASPEPHRPAQTKPPASPKKSRTGGLSRRLA